MAKIPFVVDPFFDLHYQCGGNLSQAIIGSFVGARHFESSRGGNFAQVISDSYLSQQLARGVFFGVVVNRKDMFSIVEPRYRSTQLIYRVIHLPLHIDNPRFYSRRIDNPRFYARRRNKFSQ